MISLTSNLLTSFQAQIKLAENTRARRLDKQWTQADLAERSGVPLSTLRKFEQKGVISLEGFLRLQMILGGLENMIDATNLAQTPFTSIDEVLELESKPQRQRGIKRGRQKK